MSARKSLTVLPDGDDLAPDLRAGGPVDASRRAFMRTAAAGAAVSALASCGVSMDDFLRKHFKELSKEDLAKVLAKVEKRNKERFGRDTKVTAEGPRAGVELRAPRIGAAASRAPIFVRNEHVAGGVNGLHRSDDVQLCQSTEVVGVQQLHMLDAMAQAGIALLFADHRQHVQHIVVGFVADGVNSGRQTCRAGFPDVLEHLFLVARADAAIAAAAFVRIDHQRGLRAERAVGKTLDAVDAQPIIAKARSDA